MTNRGHTHTHIMQLFIDRFLLFLQRPINSYHLLGDTIPASYLLIGLLIMSESNSEKSAKMKNSFAIFLFLSIVIRCNSEIITITNLEMEEV